MGLLDLSARIYGGALRALPEPLRSLYGGQMRQDFREMAEQAWTLGGRGRLSLLLLRSLWDLGRVAVAERVRRSRWTAWTNSLENAEERMMEWLREFRSAARALARRPAFAGIAALTLALGIGANVAIFTVVNTVLLRPLPYPDSDRLVEVNHHAPAIGLDELNNSPGTVSFYREHAEFFSAFGAYDGSSYNLTGGDEPARIRVARMTPDMFQVLEVGPALGRGFLEEDALEGAQPVALLTHDMWTSRFGSDPSVLGSTIYMDGVATEIVGIMPRGFAFPNPDFQAYIPLPIPDPTLFGEFGMSGLARLAPGITVEAARQRVAELQTRIPEFVPDVHPDFLEGLGWSSSVDTMRNRMVGDVQTILVVVLGTVGVLLLIAFANVANLFLVRAEGRQQEIAIRGALGAGRARIARTFITESLLLGLAGGGLGVLLAGGGIRGLTALGGADLPRLHEVSMDGRVLFFALGLSVAAGLFLGSLPMLRYTARGFAEALRDGGRGTTAGRSRHRVRNLLVTGQLAMAMVLLVGSGLMLRSFVRLNAADPGFSAPDVVTVGLSFGDDGDREAAATFYREVLERAAALPGVAAVGASGSVPLVTSDFSGGSFRIESEPREEGDIPPVAMYDAFTPGYLETMGIPLLAGRDVEWSDVASPAPVAWVNQSVAEDFLGGVEAALGKRITWGGTEVYAEIVGVVGDVRYSGVREEATPLGYIPLITADWSIPQIEFMTLAVEVPGDATSVVPALRDVVRELNPNVPITQVRTMADIRAESVADTSFTLILLGIASMMALLLGAVGLYGVISYAVAQRTQEIGVRMALGADRQRVQKMVVRQGLGVTAVGLVLGVVGAFALSRLLKTLLFEVEATDPLTFVVVPVVLAAVSTAAAWLPARRASRVDPARALRGK